MQVDKISTGLLLKMWRNHYMFSDEPEAKLVKAELDTRPHVPNKIEAKKIRQLNALARKGQGKSKHK